MSAHRQRRTAQAALAAGSGAGGDDTASYADAARGLRRDHATVLWLVRSTGLWSVAVLVAWTGVGVSVSGHGTGLAWDAKAYWLTGHTTELYGRVSHAFLYSPAFAQAVRPLTWLPESVFCAIWIAAEGAAFAWLLSPLGWSRGVPAMLLCVPELMLGNIYAFLGLALVCGFRHPGTWALPLLTKVVPGIGILWFAVRREWRSLTVVVCLTLFLAALSFSLSPSGWQDWINFLTSGQRRSQYFYPLRIFASLAIIVLSARTGRTRLLPAAMLLALPVIGGISVLTMFAAYPRLKQSDQLQDEGSHAWVRARLSCE